MKVLRAQRRLHENCRQRRHCSPEASRCGRAVPHRAIWTILLLSPFPATSSLSHSTTGSSAFHPPPFASAYASLLLLLLLQTYQHIGIHCMPTCPPRCSCKWINGKETVDCFAANFNVVPDVLDPGTQVLDLTKNKLSHLSAFVFSRVHLINLQRIRLEDCKLKSIDDLAFANLTNLVELDLSDNYLPSVPTTALTGIPGLRELRLNGNKIVTIEKHAFIVLPNLSRLEMSRCELQEIDPEGFAILKHLRTLKLDSNSLTVLRPGVFEPLVNLHGVLLHENPWRCDCNLLATRKWMEDRKVPLTVPPVCAAPVRLADMPWTRLTLDEYACPPVVTAVREVVRGYSGRNVTVACTARGSPSAEVFWEAKDKHLLNHSLLPQPPRPTPSGKNSSSVPGKETVQPTLQQMVTIWESDRPGRTEVELSRASYLTVVDAHESNSGTFLCVASNKAGKASANVTLIVVREGRLRIRGLLSSGVTTGLALFGALLFLVVFCVVSGVVIRRRRRVTSNGCVVENQGHVAKRDMDDGDLMTSFRRPQSNGGAAMRSCVAVDGEATVLSNHAAAVDDDDDGFLSKDDREEGTNKKVIQKFTIDDGDDLFPRMNQSSLRRKPAKSPSPNPKFDAEDGRASKQEFVDSSKRKPVLPTTSSSFQNLLPSSSRADQERVISNSSVASSSPAIQRRGVDDQSIQLQSFMDEYQSLQDQLRKVKQKFKQPPKPEPVFAREGYQAHFSNRQLLYEDDYDVRAGIYPRVGRREEDLDEHDALMADYRGYVNPGATRNRERISEGRIIARSPPTEGYLI